MTRYRYTARACRNPRCREDYQPVFVGGRFSGLCPSCRLAGQYGAGFAFAAILVYHALQWWVG